MASSSDFVNIVHPSALQHRLKFYDRHRPPTDQPENDAAEPTRAVPHGFIDAMVVREEVYVKEQHVPLANELDDDDERSFHWVAYASLGGGPSSGNNNSSNNGNGNGADRRASSSTRIPIGTIRLVPPAMSPSPPTTLHSPTSEHEHASPTTDDEHPAHEPSEPFIKLGRLAVIKEFRKAGISRLLIETALAYARDHPNEMMPSPDPTQLEQIRHSGRLSTQLDWKGLTLVHAQAAEGVQRVWRRYGFDLDPSMGRWFEEGIEHVGMSKRLEISEVGRRKSRVFLGGSIT